MKLRICRIRFHMQSGAMIETWTHGIQIRNDSNVLNSLTLDGGMPFYIRLSDISCIESRRVLNWRRLFR